ncbi:hypothetical protein ACKI1O_51980, partial [Streptomyces scabiei]
SQGRTHRGDAATDAHIGAAGEFGGLAHGILDPGLDELEAVPLANSIGGRSRCVSTRTGTRNGGSSPHHPRQSGSSGNEWMPNI